MNRTDKRFASWVISVTSILYGIVSSSLVYQSNFYGQYIDGAYRYLYYTPFILLVVFGITKIIGLFSGKGDLKRMSIVGLMFSWGFIWTANVVNFITIGPNRSSILIIPILAICGYVALRGDYSDK